MPINQDQFNTGPHSPTNKLAVLNGLQDFTQSLEKYFFAQVTVRDSSYSKDHINLVIELNCGLTLQEMLIHYQNKNWGHFSELRYSLQDQIDVLRSESHFGIHIEEFSIFLKDTAIIIDQINNYSISGQLPHVLDQLSTHFKQYTKGCAEIPYEIFIAVFEDDFAKSMNIPSETKAAISGNSNFWALYFESEDDAVIYDLKKALILYEDLHMLNQ